MIFGIGTDIVRVARMDAALERHGERFARRILCQREFAEFRQAPHPARFLAKRFAAKEAAAKALGTGFRHGLSLRHIAVRHESEGRPCLHLSERARHLAEERSIGETHLSLADEDDYAIAYVVMLKRDGAPCPAP